MGAVSESSFRINVEELQRRNARVKVDTVVQRHAEYVLALGAPHQGHGWVRAV